MDHVLLLDMIKVSPKSRAVGRCENPGVPVLFGGQNRPPPHLVEIGLTDTASPGTTPLKRLLKLKVIPATFNYEVLVISKDHLENIE